MNFGEMLVHQIDEHIRTQLDTLTCADVSRIYFDWIQTISKYGGNPKDFTGLTEFLIYRLISYLNVDAISNEDIYLDCSGSIGQRQPDLIIYKGTKPVFSIQVKSNYSKIKEDYDRHMEVKAACPSIKFATIAFEVREPSHVKQIHKFQAMNRDYQCLILKDNEKNIKDELESLGLILR